MKRTFLLLTLLCSLSLFTTAQTKFVDAVKLGIHGHAQKTDKSPYYRYDNDPYEGLSPKSSSHAKKCPGLYVVFKTNSTKISASWENVITRVGTNTTCISQTGLDLYIKDNGKWHYAAVGGLSIDPKQNKHSQTLIKGLTGDEKECLLYLPLWCEVTSLEIGIDEGATIEGLPSPFRHKVIVHGSSITHGASASRPGMAYPAQLSRNLGIDFINFGFSGQCRMQLQFLEILKDCEADAYLFDAFSNPTVEEVRERLRKFVEELVKAHPGKPLIFLQSPIGQDSRFDIKYYENRMNINNTAAQIMKELTKRYKDVYFLEVKNVFGTDATIDNVHPTDLGFERFLNAYQPKIAKILKRYGIK
jgi:lysophospholipase L1-like esterase